MNLMCDTVLKGIDLVHSSDLNEIASRHFERPEWLRLFSRPVLLHWNSCATICPLHLCHSYHVWCEEEIRKKNNCEFYMKGGDSLQTDTQSNRQRKISFPVHDEVCFVSLEIIYSNVQQKTANPLGS